MDFIGKIIEWFARLFRVEPREPYLPPLPVVGPQRTVGERVYYSGKTANGSNYGEITAVDPVLDPFAPYSIKFDGGEWEEGTYSEEEIKSAN